MRGQTTLDFAVGVSVFLLAVVFVFTFVPGILTPFTQTAQEETVTANRIADLVTEDVVADPGRPYLLDGTCTAALLNDGSPGGCDFEGADLTERLDLDDGRPLNVTVRGTPEESGDAALCWDADNETAVEAGDSGCGAHAPLRAGPSLPESRESVVTARRIVSIDGTTAAVEVSVW